jgi:hypothetical protein
MVSVDGLGYFLPVIFLWLSALLAIAVMYVVSALRIRLRLLPLAELGTVILIVSFVWLLLTTNS